jgi:hypothetical protein
MATMFDPRPDEMPETGPTSKNIVGHDFGPPESAPLEDGGGFGPVDRHVVGGPGLPPTQSASTE